ncbi:hypothetical protein [Erythrobacter donghaensis]|uniref:hypothetical protein n=1 Tax=Erythrobacter donghaensis TaxID=267135 RepID=UPI0018C60527|nr:hypothetical protein [Erythrobacter donghaensis]
MSRVIPRKSACQNVGLSLGRESTLPIQQQDMQKGFRWRGTPFSLQQHQLVLRFDRPCYCQGVLKNRYDDGISRCDLVVLHGIDLVDQARGEPEFDRLEAFTSAPRTFLFLSFGVHIVLCSQHESIRRD